MVASSRVFNAGHFHVVLLETRAYQHTDAATSVVVLMASAALSAIVLGRFFLGDCIDRNMLLGAVLAIIGMAVIFQKNLTTELNSLGVLYAGLAGLGYGAFSVCMKKMKAKGGLLFTRQLLVFGALYLAVPAIHEQALSITLSVDSAIILLLLAIFPTLLGFFCTTKAIELLKPSQVQTIELSEPLFAGVFAFIVMGEVPAMSTLYGGVLIVLGLLFPITSYRCHANSEPCPVSNCPCAVIAGTVRPSAFVPVCLPVAGLRRRSAAPICATLRPGHRSAARFRGPC